MSNHGDKLVKASCVESDWVHRRVEMYGVRDAKGREIGHRYSVERVVWVEDSSSICLFNESLIGKPIFRVRPHALRDGKNYGPILPSYRCASLEEAIAKGDELIERCRKSAAKKAA